MSTTIANTKLAAIGVPITADTTTVCTINLSGPSDVLFVDGITVTVISVSVVVVVVVVVAVVVVGAAIHTR